MGTPEESAFSGEPSSDRPASLTPTSAAQAVKSPDKRIPVLDGWRATSILLVLGAHLLPLGPKWMHLNDASGAMGMALFFTLSGFLITQFLAAGMPVRQFLARRLARIIPLGWAAVTLLLIWKGPGVSVAVRNYLFVENLPPFAFLHGGEHLWSLCIEMQFYLSVALICLLVGRRGLYLIPVMALAVTSARVIASQPISIVTWHRIDEILAGGIVALIYAGWFGTRTRESLLGLPVWLFAIALLVCSHPDAGPLQYLRPYAAALLVGASIGGCSERLRKLLVSRPMAYVAEISYALYVIHGMLSATWLGSGDKLVKYVKRPFLFAATFVLAHLSTRYYEQPITRRVREWTKSWKKSAAPKTPQASAASRPS